MTQFNDRERSFEAKFARDEEMQFRIIARRNRLLGEWAARLMNLSDVETEAYAKDVVRADFEEAGDEGVGPQGADAGDLFEPARQVGGVRRAPLRLRLQPLQSCQEQRRDGPRLRLEVELHEDGHQWVEDEIRRLHQPLLIVAEEAARDHAHTIDEKESALPEEGLRRRPENEWEQA